MVDLNSISKETAVEILTKKANEECIALGGDKSHLEVFSVDSTQVSYMPGNFSRISVKVISDLVLDLIPGGDEKELPTKTQEAISIQICTSAAIGKPSSATLPILSKDLNHNDHYQHQHQLQNHPQLQKVDASAGHWNVSIEDLDYLAIGCGLLGTGRIYI